VGETAAQAKPHLSSVKRGEGEKGNPGKKKVHSYFEGGKKGRLFSNTCFPFERGGSEIEHARRERMGSLGDTDGRAEECYPHTERGKKGI